MGCVQFWVGLGSKFSPCTRIFSDVRVLGIREGVSWGRALVCFGGGGGLTWLIFCWLVVVIDMAAGENCNYGG